MTRYLTLVTFTDEGISAIEKTLNRAADFRAMVEEVGGKVVSQYWSVGEVDGCFVFEAPDETTAAALLLSLAKQGHVRTRTMRVYDEQEFQAVLSKS
ncbi:MAG: GYD domain-containing protein [Pirellulaceae bacterium]